MLKVKGLHIYIAPLTAEPRPAAVYNTKWAYWPVMTLGGAAQVAAAHCLNEWILYPAACSYNRPTYAVAFPSKDVSEFLDFNESKLDNPDMETSTVRWSEYLISCQYACDLWRYDSHDCLISC